LPDLAGGQVQIDQGGVLGGAVRRLIQALAIQGQGRAGREPARRAHDIVGRQAADTPGQFRREIANRIAQRGKPVRMRVDKSVRHQPLAQHHMQHAVK
jgi:hypothetical protein